MGGPNSFPDPLARDPLFDSNGHKRPSWRPNHLPGQLTIPVYTTVGVPTNKDIIFEKVTDRRSRWKAIGDAACLAAMARAAAGRTIE